MEMLADGEWRTRKKIAEGIGISKQQTAEYLKTLMDAGKIESHRESVPGYAHASHILYYRTDVSVADEQEALVKAPAA